MQKVEAKKIKGFAVSAATELVEVQPNGFNN
jgi:hypothetical protein